MNKPTLTNEAKMLEEIRLLLGLTNEDFLYQMAWPNVKYYAYIKTGRKRNGNDERVIARPTIHKIFDGINHAIKSFPTWSEKSTEITAIVLKNLLPDLK